MSAAYDGDWDDDPLESVYKDDLDCELEEMLWVYGPPQDVLIDELDKLLDHGFKFCETPKEVKKYVMDELDGQVSMAMGRRAIREKTKAGWANR